MASSMLTAEVSAAASKEADVDEALKSALHSCANDPDFAIICDFLQKFSKDLGLDLPNFKLLLQWLTKTDEVSPQLREMQIKLLRKTRKTVHEKSWESALSKFCFTYSAQDAWEIERFGYKNSSVKVKLRILKELLECQFERNAKFRAKILTLSADSLRSQPIGRDRLGHAYWVTQDNDCNICIYQEHLDEEIWQVVATNRDEFVNLIKRLRASEVVLPCTDIGLIDEDTSSSSSSNIDSVSMPKEPPEEKDDSQEDEQKVPKLSIKLVHGKNIKETEKNKDVGKGEEELAAEEDAQKLKKSNQPGKETNESGDEEFEEVEEEYEDESEGSEGESEAEEEEEEDKKISKKTETAKEQNSKEATKTKEDDKKVKPLLISQNKVLNTENNTSVAKKRALDQVDAASPPRKESLETSALKKSRPSLMDSKRSKSSKYEDDKEMGEEDLEEESAEEDDGEVEEEIEEEDIDSVAAEEDENEEKEFEDDDDDDEDEENEVGEEITDPVVHIKGEGSGKDCDAGNFLNYLGDYASDNEDENYVGEEIVEEIYYVYGEGLGKECLVGNTKEDEVEEQVTNCNKRETVEEKDKVVETKVKTETELEQNKPKVCDSKETVPIDDNKVNETENLNEDIPDKKVKSEENYSKLKENDKEINIKDEKNKINGENKTKSEIADKKPSDSKETEAKILTEDKKTVEATSKQETDIKDVNKLDTKPHTDSTYATSQLTHANKMSVLESLKKELRESKQKLLEKKAPAATESSVTTKLTCPSPAIYNRKRRLTDQQPPTTPIRPLNSESEIDLNSENTEEATNDQNFEIDDMDVGGKRLKMRPKQTNTELRKKIEAQKVAANDETTSSSGGEEELRRRKKINLAKEIILTESKTISPTKTNENSSPQQQTIVQKKQITPTKVKPTLDEIIEKKLKKTPEKVDKDSSATDNDSTAVVATSAKTLFPSPNKSPITKPLKKNLLTQIRQEESDEDAVPRKRTNSEELTSQQLNETTKNSGTKDVKTIVTKIEPERQQRTTPERQQRTTPERQRKRRSSEETVPHDGPEEPEAKKEVLAAKEKDIITTTKLDKTTDTIKEEEIVTETKDVEIRRESPTPTSGRRSGRRSGVTPSYVDNSLQTKRNRGAAKKETKKETNESEKPVVAAVKEEKEIEDNKAETKSSKEENKKKPQTADKPSTDKTSTSSKAKDDESAKTTKKKPEPTPKTEETAKPKTSPTTKTPQKGQRKKREVDATNIIDTENETPVRQSRRIAQQKIREEAERRKLEEIALRTMKQELKKKKKAEKQADPTVVPPVTEPSSESEESDVETKKKIQKKKYPGKNGNWSSGSEEQEEPEEEDEEPPHYETDPGSPLFKSDHEFSPESDIEDESQVVPMKRARTVRKEDAGDEANAEEEEACQKCNKSDHPEWILLCDNCDKGYHCSCLSPVLFYIPEGDWYCPPCQQEQLIKALENQLKEFDDLVENKRREEEEVKRLAEEEKARLEKEEARKRGKNKTERKTNAKRNKNESSGEEDSKDDSDDEESSTNSEDSGSKKRSAKNKNAKRSKNNKRNNRKGRNNANRSRRGRQQKRRGSDSEESDSQDSNKSKSDSESKSSSSTYSDSDNEPIYKLRKRRQINVSYRLNEYDDLINSALKKEMDEAAGAGNLGRGKDISTIIEADKEEKARQKHDGGEEDKDGIKSKEEKENDIKDKEKDESKNTEVKKENSSKTDDAKTDVKKEKKDDIKKKAEDDEDDSDAEPIMRKFNIKPSQKKKSRKLTTLDISSEDDDGSDEDFKGSSFEDDEEEDTSISASNSDSSLEIYKRHNKSKKKRRKAARRAFRERRKDRRFVVDESDDEEVQRPKSKKKRKDDSDYTETEVDDDDLSELSENIDSADLCDDTTTDESDGAWRPNKRKKAKKSNATFTQKSPKTKTNSNKKPKKVEYSDDDVSESESEEDDDNDNMGSGKGMGGKQPRSQPLKTSSSAPKTKGKGKEKPPAKTKKKRKSSESEESKSGSEDSTRRTRGRRYAYIEDFDDDSSDGGIKPGVQRPDTPPEEREKFIKRQEEIKRMLAEKNAEGAKLVATPRLTPIKADGDKDKRSPAKTGGDSLSTVPLSVIRQAKVLDIDYLQRRGESLDDLGNDMGDVDDDFDAELPDDLPEDMDEDAIARMVEEEEELNAAAARDLPPADEVLRTPPATKPTIKVKEFDKTLLPSTMPSTSSFPSASPQVAPTPLTTATTTTSASGLQEPVRKRLPMPTMHPPLLRHQFLMHESMANAHHLMHRHGGGPPPSHTSHLLQNALSAPLGQPLDRSYPTSMPPTSHQSLLNRMVQNIPLQSQLQHSLSTTRPPHSTQHLSHPSSSSATANLPTSLIAKAVNQPEHLAADKPLNPPPVTENKPRGRRKKITPLRDPLQKQQTAAAVTAAAATNSALASAIVKKSEASSSPIVGGSTSASSSSSSMPSSVIKSGNSPSKLPIQTSVIQGMPPTSTHPAISNRSGPGVQMPPISAAYGRNDGPRYYEPPGNRLPPSSLQQRHRGPPQLPPSLLPPHPANRSSYGPPPPLKGSSSAASLPPTSSSSSATNSPSSIRNPLHHVPPPYLGMPPNARHAAAHLNMYSRPPIYGNPNFGPRVNLRPPPNMHAPEYAAGSRAYPPYGFYPPPPPLTTPPGQRSGPAGPPPRAPTQMPPIPTATNLSQTPASVIVSAAAAAKSSNPTALTKPTAPPPSVPANSAAGNSEVTETSSKTSLVVPESTSKQSPAKPTPPPPSSSPTIVKTPTEKPVVAAAPQASTPAKENDHEPRKKLTTLQAFSSSSTSSNTAKKSPECSTGDSSIKQNSPVHRSDIQEDSSTPAAADNPAANEEPESRPEGQASEFSGLVSYFSSQHDDYNT